MLRRGPDTALAVICALAAAFSGLHPTGLTWADPIWLAAGVGALVVAARRAPLWTAVLLALCVAVFGGTAIVSVLMVALLLAATTAVALDAGEGIIEPALVGAASLLALYGGLRHPRTLSALVIAGGVVVLLVVAYRATDQHGRVSLQTAAIGAFIVAVAGLGLTGLASHAALGDARDGINELQQAVDAARSGDQKAATASFDSALAHLTAAKRSLHPWAMLPGRFLPVIGPNISAVQVALDEGIAVGQAGRQANASLDLSHLKEGDGRIDLAAIERVGPQLSSLVSALTHAQHRLDALRSPFLVGPIHHRISSVRAKIDDGLKAAGPASDLANAAPDLLGRTGPQRYLVLFTTQSESRGTGFIGNYAELTADAGKLSLSKFGRNTDLNAALQAAGGLPLSDFPKDFVARYGGLPIRTDWRFITMTPDFPTAASIAKAMYARSGLGKVDGVIRLDPKALAGLLEITGPVAVTGRADPLTSADAADYLELGQYVAFRGTLGIAHRIDALETLGHDVFTRLIGGALPTPSTLGKVFGPMVQGGDLDVVVSNDLANRALQAIAAAGQVPQTTAYTDSLGVILNNVGSNKLDAYTDRDVTYNAEWSPGAHSVTADVTVSVRNGVDPTGLSPYVIGCGCYRFLPDAPPNAVGVNRSWLTVYSPLRLDSATINGAPVKMTLQRELGRYAYSVVIDVKPGRTTVVDLHLSGAVEDRAGYHLLVWGQSLPQAGRATVTIRSGDSTHADTSRSVPFDHPLDLAAAR